MREITTAAHLSRPVAMVCATFGLSIRHPAADTAPDPRLATAAQRLAQLLADRPAALVAVTGPSGGGKSSLLRELARHLPPPLRATAAKPALRGRRAIIDRLGRSLSAASEALARAGLSDAAAMVRPPSELSEGQRHRFLIARAFASSTPSTVIVLDEFCSTLDRLTALGVCRSIARWTRAAPRRVVCATAHDDILEWLRPDIALHVPLAGPVEFLVQP